MKKNFFLHPSSHWRKESDPLVRGADPDPHKNVTDPQDCLHHNHTKYDILRVYNVCAFIKVSTWAHVLLISFFFYLLSSFAKSNILNQEAYLPHCCLLPWYENILMATLNCWNQLVVPYKVLIEANFLAVRYVEKHVTQCMCMYLQVWRPCWTVHVSPGVAAMLNCTCVSRCGGHVELCMCLQVWRPCWTVWQPGRMWWTWLWTAWAAWRHSPAWEQWSPPFRWGHPEGYTEMSSIFVDQ